MNAFYLLGAATPSHPPPGPHSAAIHIPNPTVSSTKLHATYNLCFQPPQPGIPPSSPPPSPTNLKPPTPPLSSPAQAAVLPRQRHSPHIPHPALIIRPRPDRLHRQRRITRRVLRTVLPERTLSEHAIRPCTLTCRINNLRIRVDVKKHSIPQI